MNQGTKLELPLWLAEMLAVSNPTNTTPLATLDLPPALSQRVMNALKADPKTVNLRSQAPHFYSIGARMLELFDEEEMIEVLTDVGCVNTLPMRPSNRVHQQTFRQRAAEISDQAFNSKSAMGEGVEFARGLDETERQRESFAAQQ